MRRPAGPVAETLRRLLDADEVALALPVRVELMAGVAEKNRTQFRRALSGLPVAWPTEDTWRTVEQWVSTASRAGHRFGVSDWLIAALARERTALVWATDRDYEVMASLGFVQLYE
jgi:predicted nucleic acid-binding protein